MVKKKACNCNSSNYWSKNTFAWWTFAALDVMTIKTLQEIIVNLQTMNNISVILCDHQARDLLACVDTAAIIHNGKVVAQALLLILSKT